MVEKEEKKEKKTISKEDMVDALCRAIAKDENLKDLLASSVKTMLLPPIIINEIWANLEED